MSSSNCCFLTCIQVSQEVGQVVWYSHYFQNFPQFIVIHTVSLRHKQWSRSRCFSGIPFFFHDPTFVSNLISGSSAFSKTSLNIWKFMVHVLLKPGLENFEHYFTSVWDERNCAVVCKQLIDGSSFCCSIAKPCLTLCEPMDYSIAGFPVLHYLLEFAQTHVYWVSDANGLCQLYGKG